MGVVDNTDSKEKTADELARVNKVNVIYANTPDFDKLLIPRQAVSTNESIKCTPLGYEVSTGSGAGAICNVVSECCSHSKRNLASNRPELPGDMGSSMLGGMGGMLGIPEGMDG